MKKFSLWVCALLLIAACRQTPVAQIHATLEGAGDTVVVLQKLNYNRLLPVDTIRTDAAGQFRYKVKLTGNAPYFYYLYYGGNPVASMILLPSDRVDIVVPAEGPFTIEGSEESALFQQVNASFAEACDRMNSLALSLDEDSTDEEIRAVNQAMSRLYVDYKRDAIRHVVTHPYSVTSAVMLFQRFNDELPVFGQESDVVLFKTVQDSLSQVYPRTEYLTAIRDELDARRRSLDLSSRIGDVSLIGFPDVTLPDVDGRMQTLSDLEGQVIVLSFWSAGQDEHKLFNVDLAELYAKYHGRGLEVYQISLDIDKPGWASIVRSQQLPWISVNDGLGTQSPSVISYNIGQIPSLFVIDRSGDIVARDVFEKDELDKLVRKLL